MADTNIRATMPLLPAHHETVAALYVDPRGPYPHLPGVDCWDETRDAKTYKGPHPVVAHPPCGPWSGMRHLSRRPDPSCGPRAVEQVRAFGGVLEHPAYSLLWDECGLPRVGDPPDAWGGYTIEVSQCDWGHVARKWTWLYCVGVPPELAAFRPPRREPTHWVSGGRPRKGQARTSSHVPEGIKVCSAEQRRRTPVAFAEWLVSLARAASTPQMKGKISNVMV